MLLKILGSHSAIHANVTKRRRCIRTDCAQRRRPAYGKNILYVALARGTDGFVQFVSLFRLRVLSRIAIFIRRIPARVCFLKKYKKMGYGHSLSLDYTRVCPRSNISSSRLNRMDGGVYVCTYILGLYLFHALLRLGLDMRQHHRFFYIKRKQKLLRKSFFSVFWMGV